MTLNQEGTGLSNSKRGKRSLIDDQDWSKRAKADENKVNGVSTRRRKLTEKGRG